MKISIIQMNVKLKENELNYRNAKRLIEKSITETPDIVVLPETWNCGFFPQENLNKYAENNGSITIPLISKLANKYKINIVAGSIVNKRENKIYNTSFSFNRDGKVINLYDKSHLFSPMGEHLSFTPGNNLSTFEIDGILCGVLICYDIRFLELVRTLALKGIKILFVVAHWPENRVEHWELLNRVRAIENQFFVIGVNACGEIDGTKFAGNSLAVDPWGNIITKLSNQEEINTFEINLKEIEEIRNKINIFKDRRPILYKY